MELPSSRELELEILLRERDAQLTELTDEVAELRQYLSKQPGPSSTDPVSLPPAFLSLLLPHFHSAATKNTGSNTVTTALTQRAHLLQEENDELYGLLKHSETGKLKDEVRGLRRVVAKLEAALNDSHQIINSLSTELDKSYELINSSRQMNSVNNAKPHSYSPRNSNHPTPHSESAGNGTTASKQLPTGPRAYKKPRLSDSQMSPPPRPIAPLPSHKSYRNHPPNTPPRPRVREHSRHEVDSRGVSNAKMEVDDASDAPPPPTRERERNRERERDKERERGTKERERDRGREWDRDSHKNTGPRRNGTHVAGSGRGAGGSGLSRKGNERNHLNTHGHASDHTSRTLQERLGL